MSAGELSQIPFTDLRLSSGDLEAVAETLRSGWLTMGPRTAEFEAAFAEHLGRQARGGRDRAAPRPCTWPTWPPGSGPGDEVIVPSFTFAATAAAVLYCGATPGVRRHRRPRGPRDRPRRRRGHDHASAPRRWPACTSPATRRRRTASPSCATDHGLALIEDVAHAPSATLDGRKLGTIGLAGALLVLLQQDPGDRRGRPAGHRRRRRGRPGAQPPLARDDVGHLGPPLRAHRHLRRDRPGLQLPPRRAALGAGAVAPGAPGGGHRGAPRAWCASYRERLGGLDGLLAALRGRGRGRLVLLRDAGDGARPRAPRRVPRPPVRDATACRPASSTRPSTSSRPTASGFPRRGAAAHRAAPPAARSPSRSTRT